jgi:hypothetical protein
MKQSTFENICGKYFTLDEFDSPDIARSGLKFKESALRKLVTARKMARVPFVLTSAVRSFAYNKEVGGVSDSSHLIDNASAVDISCECESSVNRLKIVVALLDAGFRRIGIAETFIHVDDDKNKSKCMWVYK